MEISSVITGNKRACLHIHLCLPSSSAWQTLRKQNAQVSAGEMWLCLSCQVEGKPCTLLVTQFAVEGLHTELRWQVCLKQ